MDSPRWEFFLARSADMSRIGELTQATARKIVLGPNRSGSFSCSLPIDDELSESTGPLETCIIAERNSEVVWSGPVWTDSDDAAAQKVTVNAVGWFEYLTKRFTDQRLKFENVDAGTIASTLLANASAQSPTYVTIGTVETTQPRTISYERYQSVGEAIHALSQIESGFDYEVDPQTRQLNLYAKRETVRKDVVFGYGDNTPQNLANAIRERNGAEAANWVLAEGRIGAALSTDEASISRYSLLQDRVTLSDVVSKDVLLAFSGVEVIFRKDPITTYRLVLPTSDLDRRVPRPFEDFFPGDSVFFYVNKGRFQVSNQRVRVFALSISVDDNGNEKIDDFTVTPQ